MVEFASTAIEAVLKGQKAFCKFLSANDTGVTGGHQAGIYISKESFPILFDTPGQKGGNKDKWVKIKWQNEFETTTRFIYYGRGTRDEYRITNFGRGFPYLRSDYTGALFVLIEEGEKYFQGFILNTDDEINQFMGAFGLSVTETNRLIRSQTPSLDNREKEAIQKYLSHLTIEFPTTETMSKVAREIYNNVYNHHNYVWADPDKILLKWTKLEYRLFMAIEEDRYKDNITKGFIDLEDFVKTANKILNRRKSRAGRSLEHHLAAIFDANQINYSAQAITEGNKRPDFLFPSIDAYKNSAFPKDRIVTLAAKTTLKDRWRQILNEANRLKDDNKFLCTLQQGVSPAQMDEMEAEKVILVVPKEYISNYPKDRQGRIWTIVKFIKYLKEL